MFPFGAIYPPPEILLTVIYTHYKSEFHPAGIMIYETMGILISVFKGETSSFLKFKNESKDFMEDGSPRMDTVQAIILTHTPCLG